MANSSRGPGPTTSSKSLEAVEQGKVEDSE